MSPDISILLPVYNERDNLRPLFNEIKEVLSTLSYEYEVLFIDDGSNDGSDAVLRQLALEYSQVRVVSFRRNCGQTAAMDAGFRFAAGKILVTMDADCQNDPKDLVWMLEELEKGYDVVSGRRKNRKDNFLYRTLPSKIANYIIRKVTGSSVSDQGCSLRVYRRDLTKELRLYGEMHRFIVPLLEAKGARVVEVDVNHRERLTGKSKYGLIRTFKVLLDLITILFFRNFHTKPNYAFGGIGLGLVATSVVIVMVVAFQKYYAGTWVHRNPLFLIAIIACIVGIQFLVFGLLAELLVRTYFESSQQVPYVVSEFVGFEKQRLQSNQAAVHPGSAQISDLSTVKGI